MGGSLLPAQEYLNETFDSLPLGNINTVVGWEPSGVSGRTPGMVNRSHPLSSSNALELLNGTAPLFSESAGIYTNFMFAYAATNVAFQTANPFLTASVWIYRENVDQRLTVRLGSNGVGMVVTHNPIDATILVSNEVSHQSYTTSATWVTNRFEPGTPPGPIMAWVEVPERDTNSVLRVRVNGAGNLALDLRGMYYETMTGYHVLGPVPVDSKWHHLAVVKYLSVVKMYLDYALVRQVDLSWQAGGAYYFKATHKLLIGDGSSIAMVNHFLDELRISRQALTPTQFKQRPAGRRFREPERVVEGSVGNRGPLGPARCCGRAPCRRHVPPRRVQLVVAARNGPR